MRTVRGGNSTQYRHAGKYIFLRKGVKFQLAHKIGSMGRSEPGHSEILLGPVGRGRLLLPSSLHPRSC